MKFAVHLFEPLVNCYLSIIMKPTLQLKLSQQLKLTPQLQQSIRLLQLSTLELNQEIERFIQDNPLLELDDREEAKNMPSETLLESPISEFQINPDSEQVAPETYTDNVAEINREFDSDWSQDQQSYGMIDDNEQDMPQLAAKPQSLREYLNFQISLSQISERNRSIVGLLIDSLNEDGYLAQELKELVEFLPPELEIGLDDLRIALEYLQNLDPPGVGARNLKECLILQIQALPIDTRYRDQALRVVNECLEILASRDFNQIKKILGCDDQCLRAIRQLIVHLNPKPGAAFSFTTDRYIVPDVVVTKNNGVWVAMLNPEAIPRLSINHLYANILKQYRDESTRVLTNQLNEAKWLIKNIYQRSNTILKVSSAIVERQRQFFEHGPVAMRPLVLREIADALNLHESTVSRVTTQKFMHTPRGIFELKYFFGSHVTTDTGGACSATAIRALIKQLVQTENAKKPLSDKQISGILEEQGIMVARRTVAKYRESMQIPPANLRKSF